jgi:hypothetical protein
MRSLLTTRRHVPLDRADDYLLAWQAVQRGVERAGGRAWIFRGADHEDRFLEFVEWSQGASLPLDDDDVQAAIAQLDAFAHATSVEEWEQAT